MKEVVQLVTAEVVIAICPICRWQRIGLVKDIPGECKGKIKGVPCRNDKLERYALRITRRNDRGADPPRQLIVEKPTVSEEENRTNAEAILPVAGGNFSANGEPAVAVES